MAEIIDGEAVAADVRDELVPCVETLADEDVTPCLSTVVMSDDPAAPGERLCDAVEELNADPDVHGILVQTPLPDHVATRRVLRSVTPTKDVDGFHPENIGRLVAGNARFEPCTPHGIQRLLDAAGVDPEGKDAVVVGRSGIVGKPLANLLLQKAPGGTRRSPSVTRTRGTSPPRHGRQRSSSWPVAPHNSSTVR